MKMKKAGALWFLCDRIAPGFGKHIEIRNLI